MIRYFRDAGCGTLLTHRLKLKPGGFVKGATEIIVRLPEYNSIVNQTSIQAIGWIGEIGNFQA